MQLLAVYTTVSLAEDARRIAQAVVERRLAACVQLSRVESFYPWQGRLTEEAEWRLMFKTSAERYAELARAILELHPYDLPALYAVELDRVHEPYAQWVQAQSGGERR